MTIVRSAPLIYRAIDGKSDNMTRYPDHGPHKQQLVPSVARALQGLMEGRLQF